MWLKDDNFKRVCNLPLVPIYLFLHEFAVEYKHQWHFMFVFESNYLFHLLPIFCEMKRQKFDLKKLVLISKLIHSVYIIHYFISVPILYNILALKLKLLHYSGNQLIEMWMLKHLKNFFYIFVRNHYEWLH